MSVTRFFRPGLALAACAVLVLALVGCQDSPGFRTIPTGFTGPYDGVMAPALDDSRQDTIVTEAAVTAVIQRDGTVVLNVTSIEGAFTATGGIASDNRITASGRLNGNTVTFTGIWGMDGFGHATGSWCNETTGVTGFWAIIQQGVSSSNIVTSYAGTFTEGTISGNIAFAIDADGGITGTATGFGIAENVSLSGGITQEDFIVMTGDYEGQPVFFLGTLDTATRTITNGFAASGVNGGITGTWSAGPAPG